MAEQKTELLSVSYTSRTALFWMAVVLLAVHWFACAWGTLATLQDSQRTPELTAALSEECRLATLNHTLLNGPFVRYCLTPCEIDTLALLTDNLRLYIANMEPWVCRRFNEGLADGSNSIEFYFYLLHNQGQMKNTGGRTGRAEENVMFFFLSYLYLVLRTVFIGAISGARATANPLGKAWQARMDHLNLFLRQMNAPQDLRKRTRQFLHNTRGIHTGTRTEVVATLLSFSACTVLLSQHHIGSSPCENRPRAQALVRPPLQNLLAWTCKRDDERHVHLDRARRALVCPMRA